ncbi:MAG: DUF262 domain-containing protein [Candidatus Staskawiczbacteria bacterium]|jgi:hypothetical protein
MPFNPKTEYTVSPKLIPIGDFYRYADEFVTRPPSVWSTKKKQALLDSLFRRYYIPKIVIREVRLNGDKAINEVVDGQQRIIVAQEFFANELKLPKSLKDINVDLPDKHYEELSTEFKRFIDKELQYDADIIRGIDDPRNPEHQKIAIEIFWRLQQGESLNFMEIAHARLASLVRNFVVKYADDITFDFSEYKPIDNNPDKHKFFDIYSRDNNRMQHLLLLTRFLLIEDAEGATELKDSSVAEFIDKTITPDGVGNESFENDPRAKTVISNLNTLYEIFKNDPMIDSESGLKELSRDYVVISFYMLLRHLKNNYTMNEQTKKLFHDFLINEFYPRWSNVADEDNDILLFSSSRQMDQNNIEIRDQILRELFFKFVKKQGKEISTKDNQRNFDESQKIAIYRRDKGLCQLCLSEGKSEKESQVSWSEYEADHILAHSQGGATDTDNAQVLCRYHNRKKSDK